jgi:hypothetical protein
MRSGTQGVGRSKRARIAYKLIEALEKHFEEFGEEAIRVVRVERPGDYLRVICSVIPKEFGITNSRLRIWTTMNSTPSSPTSAGNLQSALSTLERQKDPGDSPLIG